METLFLDSQVTRSPERKVINGSLKIRQDRVQTKQ